MAQTTTAAGPVEGSVPEHGDATCERWTSTRKTSDDGPPHVRDTGIAGSWVLRYALPNATLDHDLGLQGFAEPYRCFRVLSEPPDADPHVRWWGRLVSMDARASLFLASILTSLAPIQSTEPAGYASQGWCLHCRDVHVGLNLVYLTPGETGGTETYARELIPELVSLSPETTFTAFVNRETEAVRGELGWLGDLATVTVPVAVRRRVEWVRGEQLLLPVLAHRANVDIVHSLANTGPLWGRFRRVVTIHDIHFKLVPEAHTLPMRLGMGVLVPLAAGRSDRIITDAHSTKQELREHLGVNEDRVEVIALGIGDTSRAAPVPEQQLRERFGLGERQILLCVASKRPHKNLLRLISAVALMPADRRPVLVIPGYSTRHDAELEAYAATLGLTGAVRLLSWVTPGELEGLYAACACLACPSLHEGFGLPVLEAMARGVPVACSSRGALAEVAGDAAKLFDPLSPTSIARTVLELLDDPVAADLLAAAGRRRAAKFSWQATARATLRVYASMLS